MTRHASRFVAGFGLAAVLATLLTGATTLAAYAPRNRYAATDTASGQISMVLGSTRFVLTLADANALAVNLTARTRVTDKIAAASGSGTSGGAAPSTTTGSGAFASGEYAVVHYRFTPAAGAVALAVTLSTAPVATGKPHRISGLVTAVGSGSFVLEDQGGASFTITLLAATRMYTRAATTGPSPQLAVGEFATVLVRSGAGINDAISVTYGSRPYSKRVQGLSGRVSAVSGSELTIALADGASRTVDVLPAARVTVNGQPASVQALLPGDLVRVVGSMFQSTFYAYEMEAMSTAATNG